MRDFIITSLQTWDIEIGSTIKNTALEISKQNRVLYINTPMDISIRLRGNRQSPSYIRRMAVIKERLHRSGKSTPTCGCWTVLSCCSRPTSCLHRFSISSTEKQCPHSPMDCRAGCRARLQKITSTSSIQTFTAAAI